MRNKRGVADENLSVDVEHKALYVLQHWEEMPGYGYKLVPEHVEIRSLYNPENPGLVQVRCVSVPNLNIVSGKDLLDSWFPAPVWSPVNLMHCPRPGWVTGVVSVDGWPSYEVRTLALVVLCSHLPSDLS